MAGFKTDGAVAFGGFDFKVGGGEANGEVDEGAVVGEDVGFLVEVLVVVGEDMAS